jgi:hypothetical protein
MEQLSTTLVQHSAIRPRPGWRTVTLQQLRVIASASHKLLIALVVLAVLHIVTAVNVRVDVSGFRGALSGLTLVYYLALPVAQFWAISVWYREGPARREYHWAMPVDRTQHDLLRVLAGAIWLVGVLVGLLLIDFAIAPLLGRSTTGLEPLAMVLTGFITGPLTVYLLCSAAALRSDHPGRWVFIAPLGYLMVWGLAAWWNLGPLSELLRSLLIGKFGLLRTLIMPMAYPVFDTLGEESGMELGATWALSSAAWLLVALLAVFVAASRRGQR